MPKAQTAPKLWIALLIFALASVGCSSASEPPVAGRSAREPTSTEAVGRQAGDPIDGSEVVGIAEPIVHVLGSVRSTPDPARDWGVAAPLLLDDLATIATLACVDPARCAPAAFADFAEGRIDVMNLAAKTTADTELLAATADALETAGVAVLGYGQDIEAASEPIIVGGLGVSVSVHAISLAPDIPQATETAAGVAGETALDRVRASIIESRNDGFGVIVIVDWGQIDARSPGPDQLIVVEQLIEAGADAIVGHGSDFLQRFDQLGQTTVVYGLGNAVSESDDPLRLDTAVFRLEFATPGRSCLIPATASATNPSLDNLDFTGCQ